MTKVGSSPPSARIDDVRLVVVVLPCVPATAMRVAEAHQLAEHLGARHHRDAALQRGRAPRGCPATRRSRSTTTSASPTFVGAMADHDARAELLEPLGHRRSA